MATRRMKTGEVGESAAVQFLERCGMRILHRNWRSNGLELDIICEDPRELTSDRQPTLVFAEVRTRDAKGRTTPAQSVDRRKQRTLSKGASLYLSAHDLWNRACRFDLLSVIKRNNAYEVEHLPHAFEFAGALGGGNAAWQPW